MSAVIVKLNVVAKNQIQEWHNWINKTHRANVINLDKFEAADKDPDTFVAGHYLRSLSDEAILFAQSQEGRRYLKERCSKVKDVAGTSPCPILTAAHWQTNSKYGDRANGRMTTNRDNHKDYSARGVSREPEVRDYFQQVVRDICEVLEAKARDNQ